MLVGLRNGQVMMEVLVSIGNGTGSIVVHEYLLAILKSLFIGAESVHRQPIPHPSHEANPVLGPQCKVCPALLQHTHTLILELRIYNHCSRTYQATTHTVSFLNCIVCPLQSYQAGREQCSDGV